MTGDGGRTWEPGPTDTDTDDWSREVVTSGVVRSRAWHPLSVVLAVVVAAAVALVVVGPGADGGPPSPASNDFPATTLQRPSVVAVAPPPVTTDGLTIVAAVTSTTAARQVLLVIRPDGEMEVQSLPPMTRIAFDRSGRWLAGLGPPAVAGGPYRLLAGPVGGEPRLVDSDVRSFAWHDSSPGGLAWTGETERGRVSTIDLERSDLVDSVEVDGRGWVRGWGEWGYALQTSAFDFTSSIVDLAGRLVAGDLPGRFGGRLPGGYLLFSGSRSSPPVRVDLATGNPEPVPWLQPDDFVWSSAGSLASSRVVLIGRGGVRADPFDGEVLVVDGGAETVVDRVGAITDVAMSDDGKWVVSAEQAGVKTSAEPVIVLRNRESGQLVRIVVPDLLDGPEWVAALAVRT